MSAVSLKTNIALPVTLLLISMISIQGGAALAKTLFPLVGAPGITALRLGLGTIILCIVFKPWRLRFQRRQWLPLIVYGLSLGGMNFLFYLSIRTVPLGIAVALEFVGPLTLALAGSRRPLDFLWIAMALAGLFFLLPLGENVADIDLQGAALALGAGALWAVYIITGKRAGSQHGAATVAMGSLMGALVFVPLGVTFSNLDAWTLSLLPIGLAIAILSTALPYSLEMVALTRMPARTFGTLMSLEPAMAALSGILFLGEMLTAAQWLGLSGVIIASAGSTLSMRPSEPKIVSVKTE